MPLLPHAVAGRPGGVPRPVCLAELRPDPAAAAEALAGILAAGGDGLVEEDVDGPVATLGTADVELEGWVDDQWWLTTGPGVALPLPPLAAVALVLAAKVLLGRPAPVPAPPEPEEREDRAPWEPWGL